MRISRSIYSDPFDYEIRQIFAAFAIEDVETTYTMAGNSKPKTVAELIIKGC